VVLATVSYKLAAGKQKVLTLKPTKTGYVVLKNAVIAPHRAVIVAVAKGGNTAKKTVVVG
jgi:hypothetical protein